MKTRLDHIVRSWLPQGLGRRRDDRVVGGVCAGVAGWLGVDPTIVRLAAVLLALANGLGAVLYVAAWALLPEGPTGAGGAAHKAGSQAAGHGAWGTGVERRSLERAVALGLITLGLLLVIRSAAPVFPDQLVWPAAVVAAGVGLVWARADDADRARWREAAGRLPGDPLALVGGRAGWGWARIFVGATLLVLGFYWFLRTNEALSSIGGNIRQIGLAILATALGFAVLLGPWILRLIRQLGDERRERIRSEERAGMAAHLHDSVLQTLALIQRQADTPRRARSLARRQERELRAWLYGGRSAGDGNEVSLAAALDQISNDVEADHDVAVDVVVVGDRVLDEQGHALVAAVREAVVNAAKHSGEDGVSVYMEVGAAAANPDVDETDLDRGRSGLRSGGVVDVEAFVRDRGRGFVLNDVPSDRRGIADSIIGRMARYGGIANVRSTPGHGTEVSLRITLNGDRA
jgi:phage shock protein PspC (stress-responsive transcriptional regulator)/two-component sensor histidine kinase